MKDVLILTAFKDETELVRSVLPHASIFQIGQGQAAVESFFKNKNIDYEKIERVFLIGFCGALDPHLKLGDILVPSVLLYKDQAMNIQGFGQKLLCSQEIVGTPQKREAFFKNTGAVGVDMESFFVASYIQERDFRVVKSVMDTYEDILPKSKEEIIENSLIINKLKKNIKVASESLKEYLCSL